MPAGNAERNGYSRDHRPDCEQLVIALIVNNEGFPFSYETFDGNRTDVIERRSKQAEHRGVAYWPPTMGGISRATCMNTC
jgi:hypothetical protein